MNIKKVKAYILVVDIIPVKKRHGRPMKAKRWRAQHQPHKSTNGQAFQISTRSTKATITVTVFIVMSKNYFMQSAQPVSEKFVKHADTKPTTKKTWKQIRHLWKANVI